MEVEIEINNGSDARQRFAVGWAPVPCRARVTDPTGMSGPSQAVDFSSAGMGGSGELRLSATSTGTFTQVLTRTLPANGSSVTFFVRGRFGRPSGLPGDMVLEASANGAVVGNVTTMVRVRRNANNLQTGMRNLFLGTLAAMNNAGLGRFADFRNMHVAASSPEMHNAPVFLPWHRGYLLDLERELQGIDPGATIPYWKFDAPAPNIFHPDFMGVSDALGNVQFSPTNPLRFWRTDGVPGVIRRPLFNSATQPANVSSEATILGLGSNFAQFRGMEGDPHALAHTSFGGLLGSVPTAARDPLFFLLHANVDRLWAKWQKNNGRLNPANTGSYFTQPGGNRIGHNLNDTMWPWNGVTTPPRPSTAPGGGFAASPTVSAPGFSPRVIDMLDYQGSASPTARLDYDYDDVDF